MNPQSLEPAIAPHISGIRRWCASRFVRLGIGLFAVRPFATTAFALDPQKAIYHSVRSCRMDGEEGAPANIAAITQTQDGNYILPLFEDWEGNIWSGSTLGLDRYLDLPTGRPKRLCGGINCQTG
jgi:hypothetical protein